ncbi:hypothetical protein BDN72DRAFT_861399 [Pluteus cervinus]|uniref:Uncharacterized protein n=1 Tax=Pluteus cervinus TaxID=181527 RepID=A0ACD3AER5_9AGAR|nr:hypothetical protein BDN72DRAFT_861399 [Pluteus cervinus]
MKIFSNNEDLRFDPLLCVFYHNQCRPSIDEAQLQQRSWDEGKDCFSTVFEAFIQECKDDVHALSSKLASITSAIGELCRELSDTSHHLAQRQDHVNLGEYLLLQNTSKMLPQDVLEEIFVASLDPMDSNRYSSNCAPLQLASAWIQRYPSYRLTFPIDFSARPKAVDAFLEFLKTSPSKPRLLDIDFISTGERKPWTQFKQFDCSELDELVLRGSHPRLELPQSASGLKHLYLGAIPYSWEKNPVPSQLTELSVTSAVHNTQLKRVLTTTTCLKHISLGRLGSNTRLLEMFSSVLTAQEFIPSLRGLQFIYECNIIPYLKWWIISLSGFGQHQYMHMPAQGLTHLNIGFKARGPIDSSTTALQSYLKDKSQGLQHIRSPVECAFVRDGSLGLSPIAGYSVAGSLHSLGLPPIRFLLIPPPLKVMKANSKSQRTQPIFEKLVTKQGGRLSINEELNVTNDREDRERYFGIEVGVKYFSCVSRQD